MLRYSDGQRDTFRIDATLLREGATAAFRLAPGRRLAAMRVDFGRFAGNRYLQLMGTDDLPPATAALPGRLSPENSRSGSIGARRTE